MKSETVSYNGWDNCLRLSNDKYELIITTDVGPRIIHFSLVGGKNVLHQAKAHQGQTGGDTWTPYGGHRLWHAPEVNPRTYQPDNAPVEHFELDNTHYFVPPLETATGIQKQISISFKDDVVIVDHTFTNNGVWTVELAPWAITVMKSNGVAIMPLPPYVAHDTQLLPTHSLTLWGYTSLNDPRLHFGDKYILMEQHVLANSPIKIGLRVTNEYLWSVGWLAYAVENNLFVKSFQPPSNPQTYPDLGTQVEIFSNDQMLELETLGELQQLQPDHTITHREYWSLHADVARPQDDGQIGQDLLPLIRETHPNVGRRNTGSLG